MTMNLTCFEVGDKHKTQVLFLVFGNDVEFSLGMLATTGKSWVGLAHGPTSPSGTRPSSSF